MFIRKIALCMILFCFASLFVGVPFAAAHSATELLTSTSPLDQAARQRNNALKKKAY